jgi:hypothetical protein
MAKITTITLTGKSGTTYELGFYPRSDTFKALGAVYVQSKRTLKPDGTGNHDMIYVGQTGDLSSRPLNHERKACFDKHGADHLLLYLEENEKKRFEIETDLRQAYDPVCNRQ